MHVLYDDIADGSGTFKLSIRIGLLNNNSEPVGNASDSQNSFFSQCQLTVAAVNRNLMYINIRLNKTIQ